MKQRNKKKSMCMAMLILIISSGFSLATSMPFTDISDVDEKDSIIALYEKGYIKGVGNELFAPSESITVAQEIQLIVNILELNLDNIRFIKEPKATDFFTEAENDAWYSDAMIIAGVRGLEFPRDINPNQVLSNEEFTYYLMKSIENHFSFPMVNIIPIEISDEGVINVSYSGAIQRALLYQFVSLDGGGAFNPKDPISRAKAAEQIKLTLDYALDRQMMIEDNMKFEGSLSKSEIDNGLKLHFEMQNKTSEDLDLMFSSGKKYDYFIYDENNLLVYKWSNDKLFTMALVFKTLPKEEFLSFDEIWNYVDNDGNPVEVGEYHIVFETAFNYNGNLLTLQDEIFINYKK